MSYKVIYKFRDLEDNHVYEVGDNFPYDNREIEKKRIKELSSTKNKMAKKLIEEVAETIDNVEE